MSGATHSFSTLEQRSATFETSPNGGIGEVSIAHAEPKIAKNRWFIKIGTPVAINNLLLGLAALLPERTGRGGARNRADRVSHALTTGHIGNLTLAERHAESIGLTFTRMITIHWEAAGVPLEHMAWATGRFIDLMTRALAKHDVKTAVIWVHESGHGKGGHCHMLVHVPAGLVPVISGRQREWLRRISGRPYRARVIHSKPIGGRLGLEAGNPDLHAVNLEAALAYILKGANSEAASQFGLERLEPGGRVIGKRCGTSQNIGAKARKAKDRQ